MITDYFIYFIQFKRHNKLYQGNFGFATILLKSNRRWDVLNSSRPQLSRQTSVHQSSLVKMFGEIVSESHPGGSIVNGGESKNKIRSYIRMDCALNCAVTRHVKRAAKGFTS